MRNRFALHLAVSAIACGAVTAVRAQSIVIQPRTTTIMETQGVVTRGIHEPPRVTPVEPAPEPAEPASPATTVESVTIEAKPPAKPEVEKRSFGFVETYASPTAKLDQFARWREPVCLDVTALNPVDVAKIKDRNAEVAKTLGVRVLRAGCQANIEIVFADRPQRWLDWVAKHRDIALGFHYASDTERLKTVTRPIQAWYVTATRSDAVRASGMAFAGIPGLSLKDETIDDPRGGTPGGCGDSRFSSCLQSIFKNVLVFVDTGRLKSPEMGPVSDYLAMLTLAQPRSLDGCAAFPSVIDLLAPHCPGRPEPDGLTRADLAYLEALYGADLEARKLSEEVDIAQRMTASMIKATRASRSDENRR